MFEQDVQLAKLLLEKYDNSQQRREQFHEELAAKRAELEELSEVRRSRESYADILAKAASLLERPDLQVSDPETSELEEEVLRLQESYDKADAEYSQFDELVEQLRERAPEIVKAAREALASNPPDLGGDEGDALDAPSIHDGSTEDDEGGYGYNPGAAVEESNVEHHHPAGHDVEGLAEEEEVLEEGLETEEVGAELAPEAAELLPEDESSFSENGGPEDGEEAIDAGNLLKRFNLHALKTKEAFTYGRGAGYVVDATSVLSRIPNYDITIRDGEDSTIRDELLRDFDQLSRELSGTFYIVFDSWYHPLVTIGNRVAAIYATGEGEGTREAAHNKLREVTREIERKHKSICVITGDDDLASTLKDREVFVISLNDFFNS